MIRDMVRLAVLIARELGRTLAVMFPIFRRRPKNLFAHRFEHPLPVADCPECEQIERLRRRR